MQCVLVNTLYRLKHYVSGYVLQQYAALELIIATHYHTFHVPSTHYRLYCSIARLHTAAQKCLIITVHSRALDNKRGNNTWPHMGYTSVPKQHFIQRPARRDLLEDTSHSTQTSLDNGVHSCASSYTSSCILSVNQCKKWQLKLGAWYLERSI